MHLLVNDGLAFNNTALRRGSLKGVLLDVVHYVLVYFTMEHRLYFEHTVIPDCFLDDRSSKRDI